MDYKNGKIYKLVNTIDDEIYVGSTCQLLCQRMGLHRTAAKKGNKSKLYQTMRGYGLENFKIVLVEEYPCENKEQLRAREEHWRRELNAKLNSYQCHTTEAEYKTRKIIHNKKYRGMHQEQIASMKKEWAKKNETHVKAKRKEYVAEHQEDIKKYRKDYHRKNSKAICKKSRDWYQKNKKRGRAARKQYYKNNRDTELSVVLCDDCGMDCVKKQLTRHKTSKMHHEYITLNQNPDQTGLVLCDCGMYMKEHNLAGHLKKDKHAQRMLLLKLN